MRASSSSSSLSRPPQSCLARIRTDLKDLYKDPLPGICVKIADESDITKIFALITGPSQTPYEGGFFLFKLEIPSEFPNVPPKCELLTTDSGRVRFNPNLYANGKVCLSILGTFTGPSWSPAQSISSVLLSIQSLMNSRPYCNEPGFESPRDPRDPAMYNECILHETIRVAFCDVLEEDTSTSRMLPEDFRLLVKEVGPSFFPIHEENCRSRLSSDGKRMIDPFGEERGRFQWAKLLSRIEKLKELFNYLETDDEEEEEEEEEE